MDAKCIRLLLLDRRLGRHWEWRFWKITATDLRGHDDTWTTTLLVSLVLLTMKT